jgi:hypothetical protein
MQSLASFTVIEYVLGAKPFVVVAAEKTPLLFIA